MIRSVGDSVSLTPGNVAGGCQFIPANNWDQVNKYLRIIERNSEVRFNRFSVVKDDADAMNALAESLLEEARYEKEKVKEEMDAHMRIHKGSDKVKKSDKEIMKEDTFKSRKKHIQACRDKLVRFAEITGNIFSDMDAELSTVEKYVQAASFTASK
jgi:hypothetical protein